MPASLDPVVPTNYGIWSGPGYAAGQYRPDPATFARLWDKTSGAKAIGFLGVTGDRPRFP